MTTTTTAAHTHERKRAHIYVYILFTGQLPRDSQSMSRPPEDATPGNQLPWQQGALRGSCADTDGRSVIAGDEGVPCVMQMNYLSAINSRRSNHECTTLDSKVPSCLASPSRKSSNAPLNVSLPSCDRLNTRTACELCQREIHSRDILNDRLVSENVPLCVQMRHNFTGNDSRLTNARLCSCTDTHRLADVHGLADTHGLADMRRMTETHDLVGTCSFEDRHDDLLHTHQLTNTRRMEDTPRLPDTITLADTRNVRSSGGAMTPDRSATLEGENNTFCRPPTPFCDWERVLPVTYAQRGQLMNSTDRVVGQKMTSLASHQQHQCTCNVLLGTTSAPQQQHQQHSQKQHPHSQQQQQQQQNRQEDILHQRHLQLQKQLEQQHKKYHLNQQQQQQQQHHWQQQCQHQL